LDFAQDLLDTRRIVVRRLAEHEHDRMIVDVEGFLGLEFVEPLRHVVGRQDLIGDREGSPGEGRLEGLHQLEAQLAAEQCVVVAHRQREAHGQAAERIIEAVAADRQVIGLIEPVDQRVELGGIILSRQEQLDALVVAHAESVDPDALVEGDKARRRVRRPFLPVRHLAYLPRNRVVPWPLGRDHAARHDERRAIVGPRLQLVAVSGLQRDRLRKGDVVGAAQCVPPDAEIRREGRLAHQTLAVHVPQANPQRLRVGVLERIAQVGGMHAADRAGQRRGKARSDRRGSVGEVDAVFGGVDIVAQRHAIEFEGRAHVRPDLQHVLVPGFQVNGRREQHLAKIAENLDLIAGDHHRAHPGRRRGLREIDVQPGVAQQIAGFGIQQAEPHTLVVGIALRIAGPVHQHA
jgi:hypothetical protein